jgi:hypothetical protein
MGIFNMPSLEDLNILFWDRMGDIVKNMVHMEIVHFLYWKRYMSKRVHGFIRTLILSFASAALAAAFVLVMCTYTHKDWDEGMSLLDNL